MSVASQSFDFLQRLTNRAEGHGKHPGSPEETTPHGAPPPPFSAHGRAVQGSTRLSLSCRGQPVPARDFSAQHYGDIADDIGSLRPRGTHLGLPAPRHRAKANDADPTGHGRRPVHAQSRIEK